MSSDEDTVKFSKRIMEKSCQFGLLDRGKQFNALSNFKSLSSAKFVPVNTPGSLAL